MLFVDEEDLSYCEDCNGDLQLQYDDYDDILYSKCFNTSCKDYKKTNVLSR